MTQQSDDGPVGTVARPRTAVLAERFPIRRVTLVVLSILIVVGVVTGSWKTLTLPVSEGGISGAGWRAFVVFGIAQGSIYALIALAYRPLRSAPRLVPLITAIGASLFLQYTFAGLFGTQTRGYPTFASLEGSLNIFGFPVGKALALTIVAAVLMVIGLTVFIARTKVGKAMRAVSEDKEIASLMGIDVNRVIVTTFAIGGVLAGVAGVLFALVFSEVDSFMGFVPGIKAFTAAVLGGIGSVPGAALGGLILGVAESVGPVLLLAGFHVPAPNQLRDVIAFTILVLVLIFRPGGILGTGEQDKA